MIEQICRDILAYPVEAGRPTQHADRVVIAMAIDIGAGLDQQAERFQIAMRGGEVQRAGIIGKIATVEVGAALDQQADGGMLIAQRGKPLARLVIRASSPSDGFALS